MGISTAIAGQSIEVGGVSYLPVEAIAIMKTPVRGDKSITLFKATAAATLNIQVLNCPPPPL